MKILYLSSPPFLDMDLSIIGHLSKISDVYYLLDLPPYFLKSSAIDIKEQINKASIFQAQIYKEYIPFQKFIPSEKFYIVNRTNKKTYSLSNLKLQKKIIRTINDINPDIIHCSSYLGFNYLCFLITNKRKVVITVHDPNPHTGENSLRKSIIRFVNYMYIKNIIILNNNQKEEFINSTKQFNFKTIFVSSISIYEYLRDFDYSETRENDTKKFRILFFGRISPYKGIDLLLKAFTIIEKKNENIELVCAGSGQYWFDISRYLKNPRIIFLNHYITNIKLVELIKSSNIIVCPYIDGTQSGVIMSSFALNKPVLATNVGGFSEMIDDGITGFLIPPNNLEAIIEKLIEIIKYPNLLLNMNHNIENKYNNGERSWSNITDKLLDYYKSLI